MLTAVEAGDVDYGFVAIENAIEGTVNVNQDTLAFDVELLIQREVVLPVHLDLMARPGVEPRPRSPRVVLPPRPGPVPQVPGPRAAARSRPRRPTPPPTPPACWPSTTSPTAPPSPPAGRPTFTGSSVIAHAIEDHEGNATRFVLVGREGIPAATGHDKTSIVVFQRADEPGSLLTILQEFAARGINLSKLESGPPGGASATTAS